jgi:hypothetical protein
MYLIFVVFKLRFRNTAGDGNRTQEVCSECLIRTKLGMRKSTYCIHIQKLYLCIVLKILSFLFIVCKQINMGIKYNRLPMLFEVSFLLSFLLLKDILKTTSD